MCRRLNGSCTIKIFCKFPTEVCCYFCREAIGDASEIAILRYMEIMTGSVAAYRQRCPKVFEVPFNSVNKYSLTINESKTDSGHWLCMKGAPERILERCSTIFINGKEVLLDDKMKDSFQEAYEELGGMGERVIGLCEKLLPFSKFPCDYPFNADEENFPSKDLRFVGIVSMIDPPRYEFDKSGCISLLVPLS